MAQLDNPRHERFCQLVAKGASYQSAYGQIYEKQGRYAANAGSRLMDDEGIRNRVGELQSEGASDTIITLKDGHKFLKQVMDCKPGEIDETSPLCQSYKITPESREYKLPDKLRAVEIAMKLQGHMRDGGEAKQQIVNVNITLPRSLLEQIQEKRRLSLVGGN